MKLIIIDRKAWEQHCSEFADFIHSIEQLIGNPPETDEWLDNEAVKALNTYHSVATAQQLLNKLETYSQILIKLQQQAVQQTKSLESKQE